ncbi:MAG: DUF2130 domain-containing protein [Nitrosotalea sp.]
MEVNTEQVECPICGQPTNIHDLGRAGLTPEELMRVCQFVKDGSLGTMLTIAEYVSQRMDPTTTSIELSVSQVLQSFSSTFGQKMDDNNAILRILSEKLAGPGIGEVSEIVTAEDLRQTFIQDEFDASQAAKHGTDIIATVFDRKNQVGKISVSVKDTKSWSSEYLEQLEKNMEHDSTKVGILVSRKLPKRVNPSGEVYHNNGFLYFVVQPQYARAIYAALRQVVIHMYETEQYIGSKEQELMRIGQISKALTQWISGSEYRQILETLQKINENSIDTVQDLQQTQTYVDRQLKKACDKQQRIQKEVLNQESFLQGLEDLLRSDVKEEEK